MMFVKHFKTKQNIAKYKLLEEQRLRAILYLFVADIIVMLYSEAYVCS